MLKRILFFILFTLCIGASAQEMVGPSRAQLAFDSLQELSSKQWLTDSLTVLAWGDSLRNGLSGKVGNNIDKLNYRIDSLTKLQLPTSALQRKVDSLNQKKNQLLAEIENKQQSLLGGTKRKIADWQDKLKTRLGLNMEDINAATTDINGKPLGNLNVPIKNLNLPGSELNPGDLSLKSLNLSAEDFSIPSLEAVDFQNMDLPTDLKDLNQSLPFSKIEGFQELQEKFGGLSDKASLLKEITTNTDKVIENAASNISGVGEAKKLIDSNTLEKSEYGAIMKNVNNPEAMKQTVVSEVRKEALNHFAGQEKMLQSAMDQVLKYKKTYSRVSDLSKVKLLSPNSMKGRPLVERFSPGVGLQIHKKNYVNFDFNPYVAFLVTQKIGVGLGWNHRLAIDWPGKKVIDKGSIYGPRAFTEYRMQRGFSIRLEGELMNTYIPPYSLAPGESKREWVLTAMTGLKKEYRFFRNIKGFTLLQFDLIRLIKPDSHSPYGNVVNARFGFEFTLRKREKKTAASNSIR